MVSFQNLDPVNTAVNNAPARLQTLAAIANNKLDNETNRRNQMLQVLQQGLQSGGSVLQDYLARKAGRDAGTQSLQGVLGQIDPSVIDGFDSGLQITGNGEQPSQSAMPNTATTNTAPQMTSELLAGATAPTATQSQSTAFPVPTTTPANMFKAGLTGEVKRSPRVIQLEQMIKHNKLNPAQVKEWLDNNTDLTNEGQFNRAKTRHEDAQTFNTTYEGANRQDDYNIATGKIGSGSSRSAMLADAKIASENRSNRPAGGAGEIALTTDERAAARVTSNMSDQLDVLQHDLADINTRHPGQFDRQWLGTTGWLDQSSPDGAIAARIGKTTELLKTMLAGAYQKGNLTWAEQEAGRKNLPLLGDSAQLQNEKAKALYAILQRGQERLLNRDYSIKPMGSELSNFVKTSATGRVVPTTQTAPANTSSNGYTDEEYAAARKAKGG